MKGCARFIIIAATVAAGIAAAIAGQSAYVRQVQAPACFAYARGRLERPEDLELSDVVIASGRFRGHVCRFTDRATGLPVSLAFEGADVPYGSDAAQVLCMVAPFILVAASGWALAGWAAARLGWPLA